MTYDDHVEIGAQAQWESFRKRHPERNFGGWASETDSEVQNAYRSDMRAAIAALADAGLVIMPKEPTDAMIHAGIHAPCWEVDTVQFGSDYMVPNGIRMYPASVYRAMLVAV